mmetsp:Transcript_48258/g.58418  ORF Transcript_48258/g.58418 Transcript_48258/m.58418 type:complete len:91 (-) Transcript_48258:3543-3815(-)
MRLQGGESEPSTSVASANESFQLNCSSFGPGVLSPVDDHVEGVGEQLAGICFSQAPPPFTPLAATVPPLHCTSGHVEDNVPSVLLATSDN